MTDRTVSQLSKVIGKYVKKWQSNLFLGMWKINVTIRDYIGDDSTIDGYSTTATCATSWQYFTASIDFNYIKLKDYEESEIEKIVIHELIHIVLNEMREDGVDHEERVVSHLTMVVNWMAYER
jgi:hypothetical protein